MDKKKKENRGGGDRGAGRKPGPPTDLMVFRVPVTTIDAAKMHYGKALHKKFNVWLAGIVKKAENKN